jgi:hypothetical protein
MRRTATSIVSALTVLAATAVAGALAPEPASAATTVKLIPAQPGIKVAYGGRVYRSDRTGRVRIPGSAAQAEGRIRVLPTRIGPRVQVEFGRIYKRGESISVTLSFYYLVRLSFINLQGAPVDPSLVSSVTVKGVQGKFYTFRGNRPRWMQGSRVVTTSAGSGFHLKPIDYGILSAGIDRSNVVNSGQQRFLPSKAPTVRVRLLLYSATFDASDAFFGFPIGSAIDLSYPSGRVERHKLDGAGRVSLTSLPRGDYKVKVRGPGFSFTRPVALSRNQEVKLQVLSYLDIGLVLLVGLAFALGLPLIQRPWLLSRLRRSALERLRRRRGKQSPFGAEGGAG